MDRPSGKRTFPQVEDAYFSIPDDILIWIISRLDVRNIIRCRFVCKRWMDLISDQQFEGSLRMPLSNIPIILARYPQHNFKNIYCIDNWWETKSLIHKLKLGSNRSSRLCDKQSSQNGFILTKLTPDSYNLPYEFIIRNPVTGNQVTIFLNLNSLPTLLRSPNILGIFPHPIRRDQYCTLWAVQVKVLHYHTQYKILDLGSGFDDQPTYNCWRNIGNPWRHSAVASTSALCLDGFLYWMVECYSDSDIDDSDSSVSSEIHSSDSDINDNDSSISSESHSSSDSDIDDSGSYSSSESDIHINENGSDSDRFSDENISDQENGRLIIAFDIKTEEFTEIPLPDSNGEIFSHTSLLKADGSLSLVKICLYEVVTVKIWTMNDPQTRLWTASQYVLPRPQVKRSKFFGLRAVAIVNNKLVIRGDSGHGLRLFVCDLKSRTMRKLGKKYSRGASFWAHQPSIASLRNCQTVIHIRQE